MSDAKLTAFTRWRDRTRQDREFGANVKVGMTRLVDVRVYSAGLDEIKNGVRVDVTTGTYPEDAARAFGDALLGALRQLLLEPEEEAA